MAERTVALEFVFDRLAHAGAAVAVPERSQVRADHEAGEGVREHAIVPILAGVRTPRRDRKPSTNRRRPRL
jgi:hypothetical protein